MKISVNRKNGKVTMGPEKRYILWRKHITVLTTRYTKYLRSQTPSYSKHFYWEYTINSIKFR